MPPVESPSTSAAAKPKRAQKRYEPYGEGSTKGRRRRPGQASDDSHSEIGQSQTQPSDSPLTNSSSPPTSPVAPAGYDSTTFYPPYSNVPGHTGSYVPLAAGYYPPPGSSAPYTPYPPTSSDSHPAYPAQAPFYPHHMPPHVYPQSGPGQSLGVSMGMMPYYQPFTNGWRPSSGSGSGAANAKTDEDDQKPATEDDTQEAEDVTART